MHLNVYVLFCMLYIRFFYLKDTWTQESELLGNIFSYAYHVDCIMSLILLSNILPTLCTYGLN